jgi:hypothetical protein
MQDLFQSYVDDLNKFRDAFYDELTTQARELSEALGIYAQRSEAALVWLMEQVSAREVEFEAAAASRLDQFRGLPANSSPPDVSDQPLPPAPLTDQERVTAAAERAVADGLLIESDGDRKLKSGRLMVVKSA